MSYNIYPQELKDKIAQLSLQGMSAPELMGQYGISYSSILNWKKQYVRNHPFNADGQEANPQTEQVCAQRRVNMKRHYRTRMKELRLERNLSQEEVGKVIGVQQTAYGRYERGTTEISIRSLLKLCWYYGVSFDYMLCLTDDRDDKK